MPGDPNRKRRRRKALAESGASAPDAELDAELRARTDEELELEAIELSMPAWARARGGDVALQAMSDDELVAFYHAQMAEDAAALSGKTDRVLAALLRLEGVQGREQGPYAAAIRAEQERRHPTLQPQPEPTNQVSAAPVIEPHPVVLKEPRPVVPVREETERERRRREEHERIKADIAEALADGQREHEMTQRLKDVSMGRGYEGPMFGSGDGR